MITFIKMVITGVQNGSTGIMLVPFDDKFHEKKDELPPEACRPQKHRKKTTFCKMVITGVENGSPDIIPVPFDRKFHEKYDGMPPGVHRPSYTSNFSILGIWGLT